MLADLYDACKSTEEREKPVNQFTPNFLVGLVCYRFLNNIRKGPTDEEH